VNCNEQAKEKYKQGSGGVTDRSRALAELTEELDKVKQDMEERGSSMTDGGARFTAMFAFNMVYTNVVFFFKKNGRYSIWTCRDPISLIMGTRFSPNLGTR